MAATAGDGPSSGPLLAFTFISMDDWELALENDMTLKPGDFIDIGNGWFFSLDEDWTAQDGSCAMGEIGDSLSLSPDVFYGPAAWNRKDGPVSSQALVQIEGLPLASGEYARYPFPGTLTVRAPGLIAGLTGLNGRVFDSLEDLLKHPAFKPGNGAVAVGSAADRLELAKRKMPTLSR